MQAIAKPIVHKKCGGIVGYIKDITKQRLLSSNFILMNGDQPSFGSAISICCDTCGGVINRLNQLKVKTVSNG